MLPSICQSLYKLINTGYQLPVLRIRDVYRGSQIRKGTGSLSETMPIIAIIAPFWVTGCSPLIYVNSIFRSVCGRSSWRVISSNRAGTCGRATRRVPLRAVVRVQSVGVPLRPVVRAQSVGVPLRAVVRVQSVRVHDPQVLDNPRVNTRIQCCGSGSWINIPDPQHCSNTVSITCICKQHRVWTIQNRVNSVPISYIQQVHAGSSYGTSQARIKVYKKELRI